MKNDACLIKTTCKTFKLTYKQLGELLGYSESAIKHARYNEPSESMKRAIELFLENAELKELLAKERQSKEDFKSQLKSFLEL